MTGTIPTELWELEDLETLDLSHNSLGGEQRLDLGAVDGFLITGAFSVWAM